MHPPPPPPFPNGLQILRRETARYDDPRGTVVLTCILGAVFLLSYVMAMVWIF